MINAIKEFGGKKTYSKIIAASKKMTIPSYLHIDYVSKVCCDIPEIAPDMNSGRKRDLLSAEECIKTWVERFLHGYNERVSQHISKMPGTIPDAAVDIIIKSGLPKLSNKQVHEIIYAHRLGMSAENILGLLLEEFLFEKLSPAGWAMAWGETVRYVDFCHKDGRLLQIKNRSNSENSSSSKIRDGKPIEKWFRVNANNGRYQWEKLSEIVGANVVGLNEDGFQKFIAKILKQNPAALAIEDQSPWISFKGK